MRKLKCFIAGSKEQETQRDIIMSVLAKTQSKWNLLIEVKSFLDFSGTLSSDGQQKDYNKYISEKSNIVVFVFDHNVGDKTIEEFVVAYKTLLSNSHPDILVFCNRKLANNPDIMVLKLMMNQLKQYYIEYEDNIGLKLKFSEEIDKYIRTIQDKTFFKWLVDVFWRSNRYAKVKNKLIVILLLLLICLFACFGFCSNCFRENKSSEKMEIAQEYSIYDSCRIVDSYTIKTTNNIIRVEKLINGSYRYLAWNIFRGIDGLKEPSLVIRDGVYDAGYYKFQIGIHRYLVPDNSGSKLLILERDKLIGDESVVDYNYMGPIEQSKRN